MIFVQICAFQWTKAKYALEEFSITSRYLDSKMQMNDLPNDTKNASSVASFKHRLNRNLKPPPRYNNAGSRKGQILQARLRLECSSLNSDLYRKHIVPSPSCQCGEFESAAHFLFNCPIYTNERQTYLPNNLRTFKTKDLLFGCENASEQDNQSLFLQVQDFIVNSGRFP